MEHETVKDEAVIIPYDPEWPNLFAHLGGALRAALGDIALRIDHIGSTSVPGLDAKPVIDVQISVASLGAVDGSGGLLAGDQRGLRLREPRAGDGDAA